MLMMVRFVAFYRVGDKDMIKSDFRRLFLSPKIYISFFTGVIILLRPLFSAFVHSVDGSFFQFLSVPFGMSDFTPFAAIFCVLPFADSFCDDYTSGYVNAICIRISTKKYAFQRSLTVALSGGITMAATVIIPILACAILANQPDTEETVQFMYKSIWARMDLILRFHGLVLLVLKVLLAFLFGCLWALVGLAISTYLPNRYVTYIAPFVGYQGLWFLLSETAFNPVYLLRGDAEFIPSLWFILCWQGFLIAVFYTLSILGIKKKVLT